MRYRDAVFLVSNIPTPYRQDFYNALNVATKSYDIDFKVFFFAATEPNRSWKIDPNSFRYKHEIYSSRLWRIGPMETYFSLRPVVAWLLYRPRVTVLCAAWHYPANLLILLLARLLGKQCWFWCEANLSSDKSRKVSVEALRRFFYKTCPGFLSTGEASDKYLEKWADFSSPVLRIPNAVELRIFDSRQHPRQAADDARNRFLFVGELSDRKGVLEMIDAFDTAIKYNLLPSTTELVICGDGPLREQILDRARSNAWLKFRGFLQGENLAREWRSSGAMVLNTKLDPGAVVINEAIVHGVVPIVSSRAGHALDVQHHSPSFNFVFEYGSLLEALERYSNSADLDLSNYRASLFEDARKYHPETIADDFLKKAIIQDKPA